jgi:phosphoadenosine phosphosulfate reductase
MARGEAQGRATALAARYGALDGEALLRPLIEREFPGRIALVSSFGTEAALLLSLVARVAPAIPILFLDTEKLFGETLRYRDELVRLLGLVDVRSLKPDGEEGARLDPEGVLWHRDADACCALRKVRPLSRALAGFDAWITGRKRYQGGERAALPVFEADGRRVKVNPLAAWPRERILRELQALGLPPHPLEADGFASVGCMPCTDRVLAGEDPRAGRWRGLAKTECGIHRTISS